MKFGPFPLPEAVGVVLAHTTRGARVLKKGHIITPDDVAMLEASGIATIIGARLEPGDVGEDAAARQIALKLLGPHIEVSPAHTGRCNLHAVQAGIFLADKDAVDAANRIDEGVTIATLPDKHAAKAGQMVATVKIIPFAVTSDVLSSVERALGSGALRLAPFRPKKFALISTILPGFKPSVVTSTEEVMQRRLGEMKGQIIKTARIPHDSASVTRETRAAIASGADVVLVVGASATSDRQDVVPAGIVAAGGKIDHFGMPVDPGNLLVLGHVGPIPALVLPGCAESPKLNGVDWVLERLAADLQVSPADIKAMGVGGLLIDTPARPLPRAQAVQEEPEMSKSSVAAIVLAAGQSRRMGGPNKLLLEVEGVPLVRRAAEMVAASSVREVIVVTGHQPDKVRDALQGLDVHFVHNPRFADGLSTSLKAGLDAVSPDAAGAVVCLGDMPGIAAGHLDRLILKFNPEEGREIGVPTHNGKRGNPVLWSRRFFQEMHEVSGDVGARHLIGANEFLFYEVEFEDTGVLMDLDTPGQWEDYLASSSPPRSR